MNLTVVTPTRNRKENLRNTLSAFLTQTIEREHFEVVISDDNSEDNTFELYQEFKDKLNLKYVNNNKKAHSWNASVPRNLGASLADPQTKAIVFLDSDIVVQSTFLENLWQDYNNNSERVVLGPYDFMNANGRDIMTADVRWDKFKSVDVNDTFDKATDGLACFGGIIMFPKKIFWDLGGYDRDTHIGLEDGEMGLRLWKKGYKVSYDKRLHGKHQWHESPADRFPPDMKDHIDKLNMKHFNTKDPDYGIIEASREAYKEWGITDNWQPPAEWTKMGFGMKIK